MRKYWQVLQNTGKRAARCILDKDTDTPSEEMFSELKWMKFPKRVIYQKAILMFKISNNLAPQYLQDLFTHTTNIHQRALRSTSNNLLYIPKPKMELYRNSLSYSGSKIWNSIPENIKQSDSVTLFKKRYLEWLCTQNDQCLSCTCILCMYMLNYCLYHCVYMFVEQRTSGKIGLVQLSFLFK